MRATSADDATPVSTRASAADRLARSSANGALLVTDRSARVRIFDCRQRAALVLSDAAGANLSLQPPAALEIGGRCRLFRAERLFSGVVVGLSGERPSAHGVLPRTLPLRLRAAAAVHRKRHFRTDGSGSEPRLGNSEGPHLSKEHGGELWADLRLRRADAGLNHVYCAEQRVLVESRRLGGRRRNDRGVQACGGAHVHPYSVSHLLETAERENSGARCRARLHPHRRLAGRPEVCQSADLALAEPQAAERIWLDV